MTDPTAELQAALRRGDLQQIVALIEAGADPRYTRQHGYDALIDTVYGDPPRLVEILRLLIASGADLDGITTYGESALKLLSRVGRFDAVQLLLSAGANRDLLGWTPLIEAVALGSLAEVHALVQRGEPLEAIDSWSRTAWLVALLVGDLDKATLLLAAGANPLARGHRGAPALCYAIRGGHPDVVRWLLQAGHDPEESDDGGETPLMTAVERDDLECVKLLLEAGADPDRKTVYGTAVHLASSQVIARCLLDRGANPAELAHTGRRALAGLPSQPTSDLLDVDVADFLRAPTRRFGQANPELIREPFWEGMIRAGVGAYEARMRFDQLEEISAPIWCAERYGQSLTVLPDGRVVQIAGEHEDFYDADFCIYNDVFVHAPDGSFVMYGYPESVFPPSDFHTATLMGVVIYVVGSLGYPNDRRPGHTRVHRLDTHTFRMDTLETTGESPGAIYQHRAEPVGPDRIRVWGGMVITGDKANEQHDLNAASFVLDLRTLTWCRE